MTAMFDSFGCFVCGYYIVGCRLALNSLLLGREHARMG